MFGHNPHPFYCYFGIIREIHMLMGRCVMRRPDTAIDSIDFAQRNAQFYLFQCLCQRAFKAG